MKGLIFMKIYIENVCRSLDIGLYDINGDEATEAFLIKHFSNTPTAFRKMSEEEKQAKGTVADYIINDECFNAIVNTFAKIQPTIDEVAQLRISKDWSYDEAIEFGNIDGENFLI